MSEYYIDFVIDEDGELQLKAVGIAGSKCSVIMDKLTEDLGEVVEHRKTPEFYQTETVTEKKTVKTGGFNKKAF